MKKKNHFFQIFIRKIIALNGLSACHSATHQMEQANGKSAPIQSELVKTLMPKHVPNDILRDIWESLLNKEVEMNRFVSQRFEYVIKNLPPSLHQKRVKESFYEIDFDYLESLTYEEATEQLQYYLKKIVDHNMDKVLFKGGGTKLLRWFSEWVDIIRNIPLSCIKVVDRAGSSYSFFTGWVLHTFSPTLRSLEIDGGTPLRDIGFLNPINLPALKQLYLNTNDVDHRGNYIKYISRFITLTHLSISGRGTLPNRSVSFAPLEALKELKCLSMMQERGLRDGMYLIGELSNRLKSLDTLTLDINMEESDQDLTSLRNLKIKNKNLKTLRLIHNFAPDQEKSVLEGLKAAHKDKDITIELIHRDKKKMWEKYFTYDPSIL